MTTTTVLSPEDLLNLPDDGRVYELIHGELVEKNVSKESSRIGNEVAWHITSYQKRTRRGWSFGQDTGFRCFADTDDPDRVRKPDAAFISFERMPVATYEDEGYCTFVPDLVVEVISPNDLSEEVEAKKDEWLEAGVKSVWIVNPGVRTVRIERQDGSYARYRYGDTLADEAVLPGFAVAVAELFDLPKA
jgi:Uma2 family endonuclease